MMTLPRAMAQKIGATRNNLGETPDYFLTTEVVRVPGTLNLLDTVYVAVNKQTGVREFRWGQLGQAIGGVLELQRILDAAVAEAKK